MEAYQLTELLEIFPEVDNIYLYCKEIKENELETLVPKFKELRRIRLSNKYGFSDFNIKMAKEILKKIEKNNKIVSFNTGKRISIN